MNTEIINEILIIVNYTRINWFKIIQNPKFNFLELSISEGLRKFLH
jgi:hypothetical protein